MDHILQHAELNSSCHQAGGGRNALPARIICFIIWLICQRTPPQAMIGTITRTGISTVCVCVCVCVRVCVDAHARKHTCQHLPLKANKLLMRYIQSRINV